MALILGLLMMTFTFVITFSSTFHLLYLVVVTRLSDIKKNG